MSTRKTPGGKDGRCVRVYLTLFSLRRIMFCAVVWIRSEDSDLCVPVSVTINCPSIRKHYLSVCKRSVCVPGRCNFKSRTFVHQSLSRLTDGQIKPLSRIGMKGSHQVTALIPPFVSSSFRIQLIILATELNNIELTSHNPVSAVMKWMHLYILTSCTCTLWLYYARS